MKCVATVAVVYDGKLLMGLRRQEQRWTCPGGHLEEGETFLQGAVRELREESGIEAAPGGLKQIGHSSITKPDGEKLEVTAYVYAPKVRPKTTMRGDPDVEVRRWQWVSIRDGLPPHIVEKLHVPLERNVLMKGLGVHAMEKTAFWEGFDKQANMLTAAGGLMRRAVASPLAGKVVGAGQRAAGFVARHPVASAAAGAGAAGIAAGRMSKANQPQAQGPQYPY